MYADVFNKLKHLKSSWKYGNFLQVNKEYLTDQTGNFRSNGKRT